MRAVLTPLLILILLLREAGFTVDLPPPRHLPAGVTDFAFFTLHGFGHYMRVHSLALTAEDVSFFEDVSKDKGNALEAVHARYNLAWLYVRDGRRQDGVAVYSRALKLTMGEEDRKKLIMKSPGEAMPAGEDFDFQMGHCRMELEHLLGNECLTFERMTDPGEFKTWPKDSTASFLS